MKKLLALLLAVLMLFGLGAGASAQTPEEMLTQTMKDLRGDYTIQGDKNDPGYYEKVICYDGNYAFIRADGVRDIHYKGRVVRVYPERNAYHKLSSSYSFDYLPLLTPKEIPENAPITAKEWYGSIEIPFEGNSYWYKEGSLWSIDGGPAPGILIGAFSGEADPGVFSLDGLREVPELSKWLWEPQESVQAFLGEHAMADKFYGAMLSAGLTALVIMGLPLLYVLVLVLRVLFYFDIYKV